MEGAALEYTVHSTLPDKNTVLLGFLFGSLKEILEITLLEAAEAKGDGGLAWLALREEELVFPSKADLQ
jgi:hypothetical protein